jgi:hypothetical protein
MDKVAEDEREMLQEAGCLWLYAASNSDGVKGERLKGSSEREQLLEEHRARKKRQAIRAMYRSISSAGKQHR